MGVPLYQVDSFTAEAFAGNPAGVCLLDAPADEGWMRAVAREMNLSETAFLHPDRDGYALRWFTPAVEVELCGHATLASAHVLWTEGLAGLGEELRFYTVSGRLTALRRGEWIELNFPARPPEPVDDPDTIEKLCRAVGVPPVHLGRSRDDFLAVFDSAEVVRSLRPDFALMRALDIRGVIVTARDDSGGYDFVSRFFAPGAGIDEDPVTGSAHCCLGPYWGGELGKGELVGFQASSRGGVVRVKLAGERVLLGGRAVTVFRADLNGAPSVGPYEGGAESGMDS
jgi:PhzF family phenazine biosynthesis protein